jgi:signal transduction histidine kinase/ActR/RegA family two-component response regulator
VSAASNLTPAVQALNRRDDRFCEEMSRTNNELANLQRELARKNAELASAQKALQTLNEDLEQRVAQRTKALFAATQEAVRANAAKSEFLSRTSHELRTPLNAILGFGQLLEQEENLGPVPRESVGRILQAGRRLLSLINDVLDISSADSGGMTLSLEPVAVDELIEETLGLVRPLGATLGVELEVASPKEGNRSVLADRQRFKQTLLNLLSNAIKYNRPGGKVIVESAPVEKANPPALRLLVKDTGPGISAENLTRLFMPFDRLDVERVQPAIPGSGLGLALSKRMVESMGGCIGVESVPGEGSVFWIEAPLADNLAVPSAQSAPGPLVPAESESLRSGTLLCIDGNASHVRLITHILARRPAMQLLSAETGALGLEIARERRPDLILLDLRLPEDDGEQVLARLRADPRTSPIPVAVIGADFPPEKREQMTTAGASAFLTKPLQMRTLLGLLDQFVKFQPDRKDKGDQQPGSDCA